MKKIFKKTLCVAFALCLFLNASAMLGQKAYALTIYENATNSYASKAYGNYIFSGSVSMAGKAANATSTYGTMAGLSVGIRFYYFSNSGLTKVTSETFFNSNASTTVSVYTGNCGYGGRTAYAAHEASNGTTPAHIETVDSQP